MDTREKVVAIERLPAVLNGSEWTILAGFFDPMTAEQANRIARRREPGRKLAVVVLESGESLLPATARAAMVAALRCVDAVAVATPEQVNVDREEIAAERARTAEFVQFILDRRGVSK